MPELTHTGGRVEDADVIECANPECDHSLPAGLAWMFETNLGCPECGQ